MGKETGISWCDHTANFWWGCQKVSEGCKNCYAETLAVERYKKPIWGPAKTTARERKKAIWNDIVKWDQQAGKDNVRRRVFVSSMSDFLEDHPQLVEWREEAMYIMERLENLDVLLLTKRPENSFLLGDWDLFGLPPHIWFGTTVEDNNQDQRIQASLKVMADVHFFSVEPMLEKVNLFDYIYGPPQNKYWVICGGESGAGCRQFEWDWARDLLDQCRNSGVPFFMKQGGGHPNPRHNLEDIPEDLRIREFPQ